jgi:hypothetical protein
MLYLLMVFNFRIRILKKLIKIDYLFNFVRFNDITHITHENIGKIVDMLY